MGRIILGLMTLFISLNVLATTTLSHDLGIAVKNAMQHRTSATYNKTSLIYGGKDISRSLIATANESIWAKQPISEIG